MHESQAKTKKTTIQGTGISIRTRYDTNKLKEKNVLETFMITLQNRYQALEEQSPDGEEEDEIEKEFHIMHGRSIHQDSR